MLECVVNVSEGRDAEVIAALASAGGACLLDVHSDPHHHRSVLTLAGPDVEQAVRAVAAEAVARIDLGRHHGVHPRLGAVDVVPYAPLADASLDDAVAARDRFAGWAAGVLGVPCFLYGPERSLPQVRRHAFRSLDPDHGPAEPHATAGAVCVGARPVLVAYNLWVAAGLETAKDVASSLRSPAVRALGLDVGGRAQVSCNLLDPMAVGPAEVYDAVARLTNVERAELVGLLPAAVLERIDPQRWRELDLDEGRTIEARLRPRLRSPDGGPGPAAGAGAAAPAR